jgi:hypothetical protein
VKNPKERSKNCPLDDKKYNIMLFCISGRDMGKLITVHVRRNGVMLKKGNIWAWVIVVLLTIFVLSACTRYERPVVPLKMPAAYPNVQMVANAQIASRSYDDSKDAQKAFGFDIRGAGILPVQVVFDNKGTSPLEIVPEQTWLIDEENNLWPILDARMAYDRIEKATKLGEVAPEAVKSGLLGGAAGAVLGAAIGIVTGTNVGEALGKGAAIGAAAGATLGGVKGMTDTDVQREISEDLATRSLEKRAIKSGEIAHGFLFFPGEAKKASELRLQVRDMDTGKIFLLVMPLETNK